MAFDVQGALKAGYSPAEVADYLASQNKFDVSGARRAGYSDNEIIQHLSKVPERTWSEAYEDIGASAVSGLGTLVQLPSQLYGLATGDLSDTGLMKVGREIKEVGEKSKSKALKAKEQERARKIAEAEEQGLLKEFTTAFGETVTDPALLASFIAEQAPQFLVPLGAAQATKGLTLARQAQLGVAKEAAEKGAQRLATSAAVGAGSIQQGADIGAQTYENVYNELIRQGADPVEAADVALSKARAAGASAAVISLLAQRLPGARTIEETFAGVPGVSGRILGAGKGALGEIASEIPEEAGGKFTENIAMRDVAPETELLRGVGTAAGLAAIGGGTFGGVAGGVRRPGVKAKEEGAPPEKEVRREEIQVRNYQMVDPTGTPITVEVSEDPTTGEMVAVGPDGEAVDLTAFTARGASVEDALKIIYADEESTPSLVQPGAEPPAQAAAPTPSVPPTVTPPVAEAPPEPLTTQIKGGQSISIDTAPAPEAFSNLVRQQFGEPTALIAKDESGNEIGRLTYMPNGGPIDIFVSEENRRKGVATALYNELESKGIKIPEESQGYALSKEAEKVRAAKADEVKTKPPPKLKAPEGFEPKEGRKEQVVMAARQLEQKLAKATTDEERNAVKAEYDEYVNYYAPIGPISKDVVEEPLSTDGLALVLDSRQRKNLDAPIEDGTEVGLRMDLPALRRAKKKNLNGSVVSIHTGESVDSAKAGTNISYKGAGHLIDAKMAPRSAEQAFDVAKQTEGRPGDKKPLQTIEGKWVNTPPQEIFNRVKELMDDPAWTQISLDPLRHSFFYDRKTKRPVLSADEVYQVGRFVIAKNAKFGERNNFLYRQAPAGAKGNPRAAVAAAINRTKEGWVNAPPVEVVQSIDELPQDMQEQIKRDKVNPKGAFHPPSGVVYVVADNISGYRDTFLTLAHEALGHFGLRSVLGNKYASTMNTFFETNREVKKLAQKKMDQGLSKAVAVEEVLAEAVEARVPAETALGRAIQSLKNILRQIFNKFGLKNLTDTEVQTLLDSARDYVIEGRTKAAPGRVETPTVFATKKPSDEEIGRTAKEKITKLGREPKPEPTRTEKIKEMLLDDQGNIKLTTKEARSQFRKFLDKAETWAFSTDAAMNNEIRRILKDTNLTDQEKFGLLLSVSSSQAVHGDAIASLFLRYGGVKYNKDLYKYEAVDKDDNLIKLVQGIETLSAKYGLTKEEAERVAHTAFEAKRLNSLVSFNESVQAEMEAIKKRIKKAKAEDNLDGVQLGNQALAKARKKMKLIHMTEEEIGDGLSLIDDMPELNDIIKTWNGMRKNAISELVDSGLWSEEEAETMMENIDYVPFYREDQLEKGQGPKEYLGRLQVQAKEKKLKGSKLPVNDVFDNMARWTQYAIKRSVMNRLALTKIDVAVEFDMARKVDEDYKGPNKVRVWRDGKAEFYALDDPMFMEAFAGLESVTIPAWKVAAKISNFLRQSVVLYPLFSVAQLPQDAFAAIFTSGLKPRFALTIPARAVKEFLLTLSKRSQTHKQLERIGAVGIKDFSAAVARNDAEVMAGLKAPPGVIGKTKDFLEHFSMASDNAVRQAVYEASMAQASAGGRKPTSIDQAKAYERAFQLINFRARGSSKALSMLGQVIPFFNAYLAAQHVAIKVISGTGIAPEVRSDALKTLRNSTAAVMALSLLYAMAMDDDDEYVNKPSVMRDRLFIVPGTGMTIPIRQDIFSIPKMLTEHMYMLLTDQGAADGRKFRDSIKSALGNALFSPTVVPQAVKPLFEVGINYNLFQGRPLVGTYQQGLDVERQFNDSTSELAKLFGQTGMISPIAVDHLVRGMFGSVGGLVLYMTNPLLDSAQNVQRPELSFKDMVATLPGTSGFVPKSYETGLKNDFYVLRDEVSKAVNTLNDIKRRSPMELEDFYKDEKKLNLVDLQKDVNRITKELTKIRQDISVITNLPSSEMSPKEKRQAIEELKQAELEILKAYDIKGLRKYGGI